MAFSILCCLFFSFPLITGAYAADHYLPLPSPIHCNETGCTVDNYQGTWQDRTPCKVATTLYPKTEAELIHAVAMAAKSRSKIKVVSRGSHSLSKVVCPGGEDGILVSTRDYNTRLDVNVSARTVTADAGVMLRPMLDRVAELGLTLPHAPYWQGVSVAGMISTGAHGSGMWGRGSAPHDYVVAMRLVVAAGEEEGYAKVVELEEGDPDLDAARLSLGVLGAISQVTFALEPMFKRSVSLEMKDDEHLEDDIVQFARKHEFGGLNWYPGSGKLLLKLDDRVGMDAHGDGAYKLAQIQKMDVSVIESLTIALETFEEQRSSKVLCEGENMLMNFRYNSGDGLVNIGNTFSGYPVVGLNHKMTTSGGCEEEPTTIITPTGIITGSLGHHEDGEENLVDEGVALATSNTLLTCNWNPLVNKSIFFFDTSISIPIAKVKDAILDIKRLQEIDPKAMCSLGYFGGIWIRFLTSSKAYLGEQSDAVVVELMYYRARKPNTPRLHQDLMEEIEQMLVRKYEGKPHWGKNRDLAFEGMSSRTLAMEKFLEARRKFDPLGLFSSEWTNAILGINNYSSRGVQTFQEHCALEGLCVCKEDSHCHPSKGYFCRPGHVYKDARVCRYEKVADSFVY